MNHNPNDLKVGDVVLKDGRYKVTIISFTHTQLFAMVQSGMSAHEVMTNRLTPIK